MWLFCPAMNSSARNDRMAIIRNSFNSASLRANIFLSCKINVPRPIQENWWCVKWSSIVTYYHWFFFRYTSLVDRYVPNIAACLKDGTSLVRRQTLTLLTHLLQVSKSTHLCSIKHWPCSHQRRFICILCKNDHNAIHCSNHTWYVLEFARVFHHMKLQSSVRYM